MKNINKIILVGRLGQDPILKTSKAGKRFAYFSLATTEKFSEKEETSWHEVIVWGKLAEVCSAYLFKGKLIYLDGRLRLKKYTDSEGKSRKSYQVVAKDVCFLDSKKSLSPTMNVSNEIIASERYPQP